MTSPKIIQEIGSKVSYTEIQNFTTEQKTQTRQNLGIVSYESQTLTDSQKAQARENLGASASNHTHSYADASHTHSTATTTSAGFMSAEDKQALDNLVEDGGSSNSSTRKVGEIVASTLPISDVGLHLLDGSIIQGDGVYSDFVDYIADLASNANYSSLFVTESAWQSNNTSYGVCGKFVYDSTANTVRLPKITGIVEGTTDVSALGSLIQAGLPNITGGQPIGWSDPSAPVVILANSTDRYGALTAAKIERQSEMYYVTDQQNNPYKLSAKNYNSNLIFNASLSNAIYGRSNTVQPQTIKVLYYIVIAETVTVTTSANINSIVTKIQSFDSNYDQKVQSFDNAYDQKIADFNSNYEEKAATFDGSNYALEGHTHATDALGAQYWVKKTIDLSNTATYADTTWYPVTGSSLGYEDERRILVDVELNSETKPSWSTHNAGFSVILDMYVTGSGWGTTDAQSICFQQSASWVSDSTKPPASFSQMGNSSTPVLWLRGGGIYFVWTNYPCSWTPRTSTYTENSQSVSPTTTYPALSFNKSTIWANLNGHATSDLPLSGGTLTGALKAPSFQATSDLRKKENLREIKNIDLSSLGTYSYNFKNDKEHRKVGLIAQEVEKICPEAVTADEDGFKSLDYNAVIALLVAKVNELTKEVNELKKKL